MLEPKAPYAQCEDCPLYDRPFVPSHRPEGEIALIVVGEAPGAEEVRQGRPFVGASGQLLDKALKLVGGAPESLYRTNAVLCRPERNEQPSAAAVLCCAPRLRAELESLEAERIITLGATATEALDYVVGNSSPLGITKRRGTFYPWGEKKYLAALHPAFVLRPNGSGFMPQFLADLEKALYSTQGYDFGAVKYLEATEENIEQLLSLYEQLAPTEIAFDIETGGLQHWNTPTRDADPLLCIVLTHRLDLSIIIPAQLLTPERVRRLEVALNRHKLIAHNSKFDLNGLQARLGMGLKITHDTFLMSYTLNEQRGGHGLKELGTMYFNAPDYEQTYITSWFEAQGVKSKDRNYALIPKERLYKYAAIDGALTLALVYHLAPKLHKDNVWEAYQNRLKANTVVQSAEFRGIKIDRAYLLKVGERLEHTLEHLTDKMWAQLTSSYDPAQFVISPPWYKNPVQLLPPIGYIGEEDEEGPELETEGGKPFNPGSQRQMGWVIYSLLKLKHTAKLSHKTKPTSTNKEALDALPNHPFVTLLREFRRVQKIYGTYVIKLLSLADVNDRVHVNFNLNGTETGRLSADDGLHGIPRPQDIYGQMIQGAFIAEEGYTLIKADFSQAELRIFACYSKEPFLIEKYKRGEDVHKGTAQLLWAEEFNTGASPERIAYLRQVAKQVNFGGLVYLGGPSGIAAMLHGYGLDITPAQLAPVLRDYKGKMPTAIAWQTEQFRTAKRLGYVQSRLGRKRRFPLITDDNIEEIRKASVNAPIQGDASDLNLLAAYELLTAFGLQVVHMVHDSIILEVPKEYAEKAKVIVKDTMERIGAQYFPETPWVADIEVGDRMYKGRPELA